MIAKKVNVIEISHNEAWRIKKNVVIVTVAFMVLFTAVNGAVNLQSSINAEAGLGTGSMVAAFVGALFSNIFLTSAVIKWLGTKWTICCSFIAHMPFIAFQIYPRFETLMPCGLLMGLSAGTLLCSKSTYVSVLAEALCMITKTPASTILLNFSGFFFMIVHMSQIWGNLISSLVLSTENNASVTLVNETMIPLLCGSNFLPQADAGEALPPQPIEKILTLTGIYLACMVGATVLIALGLDSMKRYDYCRKNNGDSLSGFRLLAVTIKQLMDSNQQLLLAINIFMGLQQAFFFADFTASFVACTIGTGSVGYVMMSYGISNVTGCFVTSFLAKFLGRVPLICSALFIHGGILSMMLMWQPHAGDFNIILIIATLWGICDSIWIVQINTYYGVLFRGKEEAAYSNLGLWEGLGYIISFGLSSNVRTRYKVYLLLCNLIIGVTGFMIVEHRQYKKRKYQDWISEKQSVIEEEKKGELEKMTV